MSTKKHWIRNLSEVGKPLLNLANDWEKRIYSIARLEQEIHTLTCEAKAIEREILQAANENWELAEIKEAINKTSHEQL